MTHLVPVLRPALGTPFRRGSLYRAAGEVPSFHIAPARTRNATDLITGNLLGTYNSASPAMAVGPDGILYLPTANAPVIEYDPTTLSCLGVRIWGAVTNIRPYSERLLPIPDVADYSILNATLVQQSTSTPIQGLIIASKLTLDNGANTGNNSDGMRFGSGYFLSNNTVYTQSIFAKAAGSSVLRLRSNVNGQVFSIPIAGPAPSPTGTVSACTVEVYQSGWARITWTFTTTSSAPGNRADHWTIKTDAANGTDGILLTGAMINIGSVAGPYVPTAATAASSTADVWDILSLTAGINNLKTLYFRGRTSASGTRGIASLNDNTANNRLELSTSGTDPKATAVTSGSTVADLNGGTIAANTTFRLAVRLDADSYALSINGGAVVTDSSGARAIVDRLFIGRDQAGNYMNGYIEEMAGWTRACTDAQVAALAAS